MTSNIESPAHRQALEQWLADLGLEFDPFHVLDASNDPRLDEYLVAHKSFEAIRRDSITFVFAPPGGGKSAFRVRLARACRVGEQKRRLFPIVYMVPENVLLAGGEARSQAHSQAIMQAAAFELLLRLAYRPHEFLALSPSHRQLVRHLLEKSLPGPLPHFLGQLETVDDLAQLARPYDPTARWSGPPRLQDLRQMIGTMLHTPDLPPEAVPDDGLRAWLSLLTGPLAFEAVYLLLDGLDAYPETVGKAEESLAVLAPLLEHARAWARERLFLKAFLPSELQPELEARFPGLTAAADVVIMRWTPELLVSLVQSRVGAGAGTTPISLSRLSDLGFRNIDDAVVQAVRPLPREVLAFVERMFFQHIDRDGPRGKLTRADFERARQWYEESTRERISAQR